MKSPQASLQQNTLNKPANPPHSPYLVMFVAAILPGVGQVLNNTPVRGLTMLFFMFCLGMVSHELTTADHSFVGRFAGAILIYSISVIDAYKWARVRYAVYHAGANN